MEKKKEPLCFHGSSKEGHSTFTYTQRQQNEEKVKMHKTRSCGEAPAQQAQGPELYQKKKQDGCGSLLRKRVTVSYMEGASTQFR
jgi:hypothetical protein